MHVSSLPQKSPLQKNSTVLLLFAGAAAFLFVFLKNAWVAEDAYILFRSVEQLVAGNGPRWNVHERVQVFTSPLWFWVMAAARVFSPDMFLNAVVASLLSVSVMLVLVWRILSSAYKWLLVVLLMLCSNAFFDYTTSGLENPLGYALIATWLLCYYRLFDARTADDRAAQQRWLQALFICVGFLLSYRHDVATLIFLPTLYVCWTFRSAVSWSAWLRIGFIGLLPFIGWSLFSTLYYGTPFPNTAYAKLSTGVEKSALWVQGIWYVVALIERDILTALVLLIALVALTVSRRLGHRALAAGLLLNLVYLINVGGDFMQGRFFTQAFLLAVVALVHELRLPKLHLPRVAAGAAAVLVVYAFLYPHTPVKSPFIYKNTVIASGIADERGFYAWSSSLPAYLWRNEETTPYFPVHPWSENGYHLSRTDTTFIQFANVGFMGYWSDLNQVILDSLALSDPLLARLPVANANQWRIGHFPRIIPEGYRETLITGESQLADPDLNTFYQKLARITQDDDLFAPDRLRAILDLNLGRYDHHVEAYLARQRQRSLAIE